MSASLVRRGLDLYKEEVSSAPREFQLIQLLPVMLAFWATLFVIAGNNLKGKDLDRVLGTNKKGFRRKLKRMAVKRVHTTLKDKKIKSTEGDWECIFRAISCYVSISFQTHTACIDPSTHQYRRNFQRHIRLTSSPSGIDWSNNHYTPLPSLHHTHSILLHSLILMISAMRFCNPYEIKLLISVNL